MPLARGSRIGHQGQAVRLVGVADRLFLRRSRVGRVGAVGRTLDDEEPEQERRRRAREPEGDRNRAPALPILRLTQQGQEGPDPTALPTAKGLSQPIPQGRPGPHEALAHGRLRHARDLRDLLGATLLEVKAQQRGARGFVEGQHGRHHVAPQGHRLDEVRIVALVPQGPRLAPLAPVLTPRVPPRQAVRHPREPGPQAGPTPGLPRRALEGHQVGVLGDVVRGGGIANQGVGQAVHPAELGQESLFGKGVGGRAHAYQGRRAGPRDDKPILRAKEPLDPDTCRTPCGGAAMSYA